MAVMVVHSPEYVQNRHAVFMQGFYSLTKKQIVAMHLQELHLILLGALSSLTKKSGCSAARLGLYVPDIATLMKQTYH